MHPGDPYNTDEEEDRRLRREYDALPKTAHGEDTLTRHTEIRPEWIMRVIKNPYDSWERETSNGERRTVLVGRVPEFRQWIVVVFIGDSTTGALLTASPDRRLERSYGGRPWRNA